VRSAVESRREKEQMYPQRRRMVRQALGLGLLVTLVVLALSACGGGQAKGEVENPRVGTDGPETLRGTNRDDNLYGGGGNDILFALGGEDNLRGGEGKDWVLGGDERRAFGGDKKLEGGPGNDGMYGGEGSDTVSGGSGNDDLGGDYGSDYIAGGEGRDFVDSGLGSDHIEGGEGPDWLVTGALEETSNETVSGADGDDVLIVNNVPASEDRVSCGGGYDRVAADTKDIVAPDCERVRRGPAVHEELWDMFERLGFGEVSEGLTPDPTVSN
jgi:Ca2+-binding RTX toxin-like protein